MHDAGRVQGPERAAERGADRGQFLRRERPLLLDELRHRDPVEQLHRPAGAAGVNPRAQHPHEVRVLDPGELLALPDERRDERRVGSRPGRKQAHGDDRTAAPGTGPEDLARGTAAEPLEQLERAPPLRFGAAGHGRRR